MKRLRVIQWTTGKVGNYSLRAILDDPRLERILTALPTVSVVPTVYATRPGLLSLRDIGLQYAPVGHWP